MQDLEMQTHACTHLERLLAKQERDKEGLIGLPVALLHEASACLCNGLIFDPGVVKKCLTAIR